MYNKFSSLGKAPQKPPFPAWPQIFVDTVEDALHFIAPHVISLFGSKAELLKANEEEITTKIQHKLCEILQDGEIVSGFSFDTFQAITRNESNIDYSGGSLDKQPDLTFRLCNHVIMNRGLFCECKILDGTHPIRDYLYKGLHRFVKGDYAWAMPHAHMIAYVKDAKTITDLVTYLQANSREKGKTHADMLSVNDSPEIAASNILSTLHNRSFKLLQIDGTPDPGPICVRHFWMNLS